MIETRHTGEKIPRHRFLLINGTWASVPATGLVNGTPDQGRALAADAFAGKIYVGGSFDHAGAVAANDVAVWNEFRPYTIIDLGTLSANTYSYGMAVSKNGLVGAGYSQVLVGGSYRDHAFSSTGGDAITDLGGPWSANDNSYIYGMNDSSTFVGVADQNGSGTFIRAFRNFLPGTWTLLVPIDASYSSHGEALNNGGVAVGYSGNASGVDRATRWPSGSTTATDLKTLISPDLPSYASYAYGINNNGDVVGKARSDPANPNSFHAYRCPSTRTIQADDNLGTMNGTPQSVAYAINDFGEIVGSSNFDPANGTLWHAFIKAPNSGTGTGFM
ncbi:MAG TPA: hypothetical protein VN887_09300, partial [Candidatus Angelobacter sp.]|nr:hypothetical protein [Candidatus Angelobacter sp.]